MAWPVVLEKIIDNEKAIDGVNSMESYSGKVVFERGDQEDGKEGTAD